MKKDRRRFLKNAALISAGLGNLPFSATSNEPFSLHPAELPNLNFESDIKIKSIETFSGKNITIVKVKADDGSEGYGQMAPYNNLITAHVLHEMIVQYALGKDPYKIASIADQCIEANYKFPWSFICRAVAGLETALWDLVGKRDNKSVCQLLGGHLKPFPAYGSSMRRDITPEDEAARLVKQHDQFGFNAFKIRVGKVTGHDEDQWPGRTEKIIPTVRKALGDKILIQADANSCYTPRKAIEVGKLLQDHHYNFFEEPCPFWELEWTAEVSKGLKITIAGGEQDNDLAQWRRMIAMDAVHITQPDICYIGGVSRAMQVSAMGLKKNKVCVPHSANLSMITLFALHFMCAIPNPASHLEYSIENDDWVTGLFDPVLKVTDGKVSTVEGPGWGVHINPDWLAKAVHQVSEKP